MTSKLWSSRFTQATDQLVEAFTESISFDKRLYPYDIEGSIAHCKMLAKCGIIREDEAATILKGLEEIREEIDQGGFVFDERLEDIHMHVESRLIEKIGPVGGKLHTARSRNDQVALDIRLYLRDVVQEITGDLHRLQQAFVKQSRDHLDQVMPGYTHLQKAQPLLFSHHLLAYVEMFERDRERFDDCLKRINVLPLGAGALAGTSFPIDRHYVAELLNFPKVTLNSLDAVGDRDFLIEFLSSSALFMMHMSRLSEELILWSSSEFAFIELSDAFCTGSSIMPQKKNPDVPELIRGKTGRVYGHLVALLTMMKALPMAYNRDMQEDKEALFDAVDTVQGVIRIAIPLIETMTVKGSRMKEDTDRGL